MRKSTSLSTLLSSFLVVGLAGFYLGCAKEEETTRRTTSSSSSKTTEGPKSDNDIKTENGDSVAKANTTESASDIPTGQWGTLKGRFVFDGEVPERAKLAVTKDTEVCGNFELRNEQLVVGEDKGIRDVVIWVRDSDVDVHPDLEAGGDAAVLDNKDCRFAPHIVLVKAGQPLNIKNSDPVAHNSLIQFRANTQVNENIPIGGTKDVAITKEERLPVSVKCSIHPWMQGYVVVRDNPYMAATSEDGHFEIANLPTGVEIEFQVWHEKSGYVDEAASDGSALNWERGRFTKIIAPGDNDLGELVIPASFFE